MVIGTIETEIGTMILCYNGAGEEMTAELDDLIEELGVMPETIEEARDIAWSMYNAPCWGLTLAA